MVRNETGGSTFVTALFLRAVDAGDAHEVSCQAHEFVAIDSTQYIFERMLKLDVCIGCVIWLHQVAPASSGPLSLLAQEVTST
jgi:hypothetical protein